jgi:hypothetical protein
MALVLSFFTPLVENESAMMILLREEDENG